MRHIFPFNAAVDNVFLLISVTLSYFCFPVLALIMTHVICGFFPSVTTYTQQLCSSIAFLIVAIYCIAATIHLYVTYFRRAKLKSKSGSKKRGRK